MTEEFTTTTADLPLEPPTAVDVPLEDAPNPTEDVETPEDVKNVYRGQAAMLSSEINDTEIFQAYQDVSVEPEPKLTMKQLAFQRSETAKRELSLYFNENVQPTTAEEALEQVAVYNELMGIEDENAHSPERQVVESVSYVTEDNGEEAEVRAEILLYNTLNDMVTNYTGWEKTKDFLKLFLMTSIVDNVQLSGTAFHAESYARDVVVGFKHLQRTDPKEFQKVFPIFLEDIKEYLPKGKQIALISAIANPRGEEEVSDFSALAAAFDVVDIATLGAGVAIKLVRLTKTLNAIKVASKLKNTDLAGEVNTASLLEETGEVAEKAGIDRIIAHGNSAPFDVSRLEDAHATDLATEMMNRLQKRRLEQKRTTALLNSNSKGIVREDILGETDRLLVEEKFYDDMKLRGFNNINIVDRTSDTTTFKYSILDPKTGDMISDTQRLDLQFKDNSQILENTEQGMVLKWLKSPTAAFKTAASDVRAALRMDSTSAVVHQMFLKMQKDALSPILGKGGLLQKLSPANRASLARVDEALLSGDAYIDANNIRGKIYTPEELRSGVTGTKLSPREIETYYSLRGVYDELFWIRNAETRRLKVAQGAREVIAGGKPQIGKSLTQEGAVGSMNKSGRVTVYDSTLDEIVDIGSTDIKDFYDRGMVLSRLDDPMKAPKTDQLFDLVITKGEDIRDLPHKVLHYKEGYVPKVNKDAYWFVKSKTPRVVNGAPDPTGAIKTERMFSSKHEATLWRDTHGKAEWQVVEDRGIEQSVMGSSNTGSSGGLYTGPRASEEIPFGPDGLPAERINTYEALGQNLHALENYITRNQWRVSMQDKWVRSAKAAGFDRVDSFNKAQIPEGASNGEGLRALYDQIEVWSGFPTSSELRWDGFLSRGMEWALRGRFPNKSLNKIKDKFAVSTVNYLRRRENNPVNIARNVAFHQLLGVLNPAQLWVQAQGFSIAAALHPKGFTGAIGAFGKQTGIAMITNHLDDAQYIAHVAKALGQNADELADLGRLWNRTGLQHSVTNTADHVSSARGFGIIRGALRDTMDKGLFFYKGGELFARRYSFSIAVERAYAKYGKIRLGDKHLKEILADTNNMMLNLVKSNRAPWQRGIMAIPTQFLQVQAKYIESMWGLQAKSASGDVIKGIKFLDRRSSNLSFTVRERMRIMAYQFGLYGAAGVPMAGLGIRWATEQYGLRQADIERINQEHPEFISFVNDGFWGVMASQYLGADVELADRGAVASGIIDSTYDLMFSDSPLAEKALGAFGSVPQRGMDAWNRVRPLAYAAGEEELTSKDLVLGLNIIGSMASSWNNAQKGWWMMHYDELLDSRGNVALYGPFDPREAAIVALGFQHGVSGRNRDRDAFVRGRKEFRAHTVTTLVHISNMYLRELKGAEGQEEEDLIIRKFRAAQQLQLKMLRNEREVELVREALFKKIMNTEDKTTKSIRDFITELGNDQAVVFGSMVTLARAKGFITNDLDIADKEEEEE